MATEDDEVVREAELPAGVDDVWRALTDADEVGSWFGAEVTWDLRPGGPARFLGDGVGERTGEVDEVVPGRTLRFRWWPTGPGTGADGTDHPEGASAVSYELLPVPGGTRLRITETRLGAASTSRAHGAPRLSASVTDGGGVSPWDVRLVELWLCCRARSAALA